MGISIGDLGSALGLGTGGGIFTAPGQMTEVVSEELGRNFSRDDVYSFQLTDDTGLSYRIRMHQQHLL